MTKDDYLTTTSISDKGSSFVSHVIKEVADVLGITLQHGKAKHAQTINMLELSHASLNQTLKFKTGERRSGWHKYISISVLNYNTSQSASIGCEPSRVLRGRIPFEVLDLQIGNCPQKTPTLNSKAAQMSSNKQKWFSKMFARMPCKPTSKIKRTTIGVECLKNERMRLCERLTA